MSLEQLERQIQIAERALQKATQSDDKQLKEEIRHELTNFTKVLEKSRSRLQELEYIKKQCDDLSAYREDRMKEIEAGSGSGYRTGSNSGSDGTRVPVEIDDPDAQVRIANWNTFVYLTCLTLVIGFIYR